MTVSKSIQNDTALLNVEGRVDTITSPQLEEYVESVMNEGIKNVTFDFNNVQYISSAGLRVLLGTQKRATGFGGVVTVLKPNDDIMEIFEMTGFVDILNIQR